MVIPSGGCDSLTRGTDSEDATQQNSDGAQGTGGASTSPPPELRPLPGKRDPRVNGSAISMFRAEVGPYRVQISPAVREMGHSEFNRASAYPRVKTIRRSSIMCGFTNWIYRAYCLARLLEIRKYYLATPA